MDEKTEKVLRELADQLGITIEHLWEVLVKQAPIEAVLSFVSVLICAGVFFFCFSSVFVCVVIGFISLIVGVASIDSVMIVGFINPEYWALSEILRKF
jgi:hypothetical protein